MLRKKAKQDHEIWEEEGVALLRSGQESPASPRVILGLRSAPSGAGTACAKALRQEWASVLRSPRYQHGAVRGRVAEVRSEMRASGSCGVFVVFLWASRAAEVMKEGKREPPGLSGFSLFSQLV